MTAVEMDDTTIGGSISRRLSQEILLGRLRPRERITQEDVSERFGTSRMPARDAIRELIGQGFLYQAGRTVRVTPLTVDDIHEMYEVAGLLHGMAARRAAIDPSPELLEHLAAVSREFEEALSRSDSDQATALNREFHRAINVAASSPRLRSMLRGAATPRGFISEVLKHSATVVKEHALIVERIAQRDPDGAAQAASDHIKAATADLVTHLCALGVFDADAPLDLTDEDLVPLH